MAKKRKYDLKRRQMAQLESSLRPVLKPSQESLPEDSHLNATTSTSTLPESASQSIHGLYPYSRSQYASSRDKPLPPSIAPESEHAPHTRSARSAQSAQPSSTFSDDIEEVNDSDDELNLRKARRPSKNSPSSASVNTTGNTSKDHILDLIDSFTAPSSSTADLLPNSSLGLSRDIGSEEVTNSVLENGHASHPPQKPDLKPEPRSPLPPRETLAPLFIQSSNYRSPLDHTPSIYSTGISPANLNNNYTDSKPSSVHSDSSNQQPKHTAGNYSRTAMDSTPKESRKPRHNPLESASSHSTLNGYSDYPMLQKLNTTPTLEGAMTLEPRSSPSQRNLLLLSPSQYNDTAFHNTLAPYLDGTAASQEDVGRRSAASSPMAKVNRQARVVETNDEIVSSEISLDFNNYKESSSNVSTPKKLRSDSQYKTRSPPPKTGLPQVPSTPLGQDSSEPRGLGLENVDLLRSTRVIHSGTPAVTNLEETINLNSDKVNDSESQQIPQSLGRKNTFRGAKNFLKHKRSTSNGLGSGSKFSIFKNKDEQGNTYENHSRHVSEGSINHSLAFMTPPLPLSSPIKQGVFRGGHNRSTSDTPFMDVQNERARMDAEMRTLRNELNSLESRKLTILSENVRLSGEKRSLIDQLNALKESVAAETQNYQRLLNDIHSLVNEKARLTEENQHLRDQNSRMKRQQQNQRTDNSPGVGYHADLNSSSTSLPSEAPVIEEPAETQKATRLKFWRRPKITVAPANSSGDLHQQQQQLLLQQQQQQQQQQQHPQQQQQSYLSSSTGAGITGQASSVPGGVGPNQGYNKLSQSYSSNAIQHPSQYLNTDNTTNNNNNHNHNHNHNQSDSGARKALNTFMSKSRSTNILDSFVAPSMSPTPTSAPLLTSTIQVRANYENEKLPLIITKCLEEVESRGVSMEGIYRISGGNSAICAILDAFSGLTSNPRNDKKQMAKLNEVMSGDINAVTSALKRYLRKLPDPLIPFSLYDDFVKIGLNKQSTQVRCEELTNRVINKLPPANKHVLYKLCKHLELISQYESVNRMTTRNLCVVFAPTIARDATGEKEMADMGPRNEVTEMLLSNYSAVFARYEE